MITKFGSSNSACKEILLFQMSILDPLLINIFECDIFVILENCYFTSYADDTNAEEVLFELKEIL